MEGKMEGRYLYCIAEGGAPAS
ncbi:MAG: hypothetical protein HY786_02900, partial [Deltaproteobacteria bacterium]|nr:hypothetical protein [Deltaproteobacteria bacterium]